MNVTIDLAGKNAVVTGAAGGIGIAVARELIGSGARVWGWDLGQTRLQGARSVTVDIRNDEQVGRAVAELRHDTDRLDILVNCAGVLGHCLPFEALPRSEWQDIFAVNVFGTVEVTRQLLPFLRAAPSARVVNFGSLAGKDGLTSMSAYASASAGVMAFTKALGKELADTSIRVNCVTPGPIDTDMIRSLAPEVVKAMIASSPMRRLGAPTEVAAMVAWLCSDACSFTTGAVFDLSGGRSVY
jgi:NAD(P)-dependent dehydrogenase (short-subunit alcohol dehydrogenase family)